MNRSPWVRVASSALALSVLAAARGVAAHPADATPPVPKSDLVAPWPGGHAETHDVVVPVVVTVDATGAVVEVQLEAKVSPELDEAALAVARAASFEPARAGTTAVAAKFRALVRFRGNPGAARAHDAPPPPAPSPAPVAATPEPTPPKSRDAPASARHDTPDVQVTAERVTTRSASDTVVSRKVIAAAPHRTAGDLLLVVPGVSITQHSGEGKAYQIFFRGFDAVHGQDLEITAGGIPVNDVSNIHGQGYADLNFLMPEVVRQIRAKPGTYDPRQGDFAVAGSLDLDLGYADTGFSAKSTLGQFGTRRYFLAYRPKDAPETTFAAFEAYATDGFGPSRAARRTSAIAQSTYSLGHGVTARVLAQGYAARFDSAGVLRLSDVQDGTVDRFATYDPKQGGSASRTSVGLGVQHADETTQWFVQPYLVLHSMRLRQDFTGYLPDFARADPSSDSGNSEQQLNDATTVGLRAFYRHDFRLFGGTASAEMGVSARNDWIDQSQRRLSILTDEVTLDEVDARVRATDVAGYADLDVRPLRRLRLRGGVRIDGLSYSSEDRGGNANGEARSAQGARLGKKITAEYALARELAAVASYGEGFRSPQARSLSEGQTTPFAEVQSFEAGVRYRNQNLKASLAAFQTLLSEDLVFDQSTARNETTPATRRTGVAADLVALPVPWFLSSVSFTYTRAGFSASGHGYAKGDLVPYAPQTVVRSDLAYTPTLGHVLNRNLDARLGLATTFLGGRPLPFSEYGHDVFLVDARAALKLKEIELSLDVFNLLDADWYDGEFVFASQFSQGAAPSLVPQRHVTAGAPRTVWLSLGVHL